jgi:protein gp37
MAATTSIAWTDKTFNPWWGCTRIGPGCDRCYAAAFDHRIGGDHWGTGHARRYFGDRHWAEPLRWNRDAERSGERPLVFCASMADVFDNEVEQEHRERLWELIRSTPALIWQIVTKRIGNAPKMLPRNWSAGYPNVWLLATVVDQIEADRDIPKLLAVPAVVHGLSIEPQIAPVDISRYAHGDAFWCIVGGESGGKARPFDIAWARSLRDQCAAAGSAFFMKQMGNRPVGITGTTGKGESPQEWPKDIRVRNYPLGDRSRAAGM